MGPTCRRRRGSWRARAGWLQCAGPAVYFAFVALMVAVEYVWPVEFRSPPRPLILVLFFGAILPMAFLDRRLWLVTVATTLLLGAMGFAMRSGVG